MTWTIPLQEVQDADGPSVGGKAAALARMHRAGIMVPKGLCVTVEAYNDFLDSAGLRDRILMELARKSLADMRWEEMWDAALRIRSMFLRSDLPPDLEQALGAELDRAFGLKKTAVRSSAPGEDSGQTSFAGLHESLVNVSGREELLSSIRKVWASLFSDAALLYRQELGLEVEKSSMAVLVQEIVPGQSSGVVFTRSPEDDSALAVEAVHGLNKGLVDGVVEPDRWILDRETGQVRTSRAPERKVWVVPTEAGTARQDLEPELQARPPLSLDQLINVSGTALEVEELFGSPQDMEWTMRNGELHVLQSRPITTGPQAGDGRRGWYLSLRRSLENLTSLRRKIEQEVLPGMEDQAGVLARLDVTPLSNRDLAREILHRQAVHQHWVQVYWDECIPFAHGARLFGQVYNDAVQPRDPFEFVRLLGSRSLLSLKRNRLLEDMAARARGNTEVMAALDRGDPPEEDQELVRMVEEFLDRFGDLFCHQASCTQGRSDVLALVAKLARQPSSGTQAAEGGSAGLEEAFFQAMGPQRQAEAGEILELARASYRLRDDDNIYLGRIESELLRAVEEARSRLGDDAFDKCRPDPGLVAAVLQDPGLQVPCRESQPGDQVQKGPQVRARQIMGQPAGPGVARAKARVVREMSDLRAMESGEILVCDAVDPNMTAMVVLAAGIVERRGGMLIHGAIIAREYGLPCVTGVPGVLEAIRTGDVITVDGYLGIVTL
jgi:pyruvate,water dikinase